MLATRTMQIIVGALSGGVLFFLAIVLLMVNRGALAGPVNDPLLTYVAAIFALVAFIAWAVLPGILAGRMRQSIVDGSTLHSSTMRVPNAKELGDVLPLTIAYQLRLILGCALLEGAAFFCLIAYLIERQQASLIVAAVLLLLLFSQIPSVARVESWVEGELTAVNQLRAMRRN